MVREGESVRSKEKGENEVNMEGKKANGKGYSKDNGRWGVSRRKG